MDSDLTATIHKDIIINDQKSVKSGHGMSHITSDAKQKSELQSSDGEDVLPETQSVGLSSLKVPDDTQQGRDQRDEDGESDIWASSDSEDHSVNINARKTNEQANTTQADEVTPHNDTSQPSNSNSSQFDPKTKSNPPLRDLLSDIPLLKRQHMTAGYREGLSIGKARVIQEGFDRGYPVGVEIGLRAGKVLGVLEGALAAVKSAQLDRYGKAKGLEKKSVSGGASAARKGLIDHERKGASEEQQSTEVEIDAQVRKLEIDAQTDRPSRKQQLDMLETLLVHARKELDIKSLLKDIPESDVAILTEAEPEGLGVEREPVLNNHTLNTTHPDVSHVMSVSEGKSQSGQATTRIPFKVANVLHRWEARIGI